MNDLYLQRTIELAMASPVLSALYVVGGFIMMAGIIIAGLANGTSERWAQRGMDLVLAGMLMAFPTCLKMLLALLGGPAADMPAWILFTINIVIPILGVLMFIILWVRVSRQSAKSLSGSHHQEGNSD